MAMMQQKATARYDMGYVWGISLVAAMGGLLFGYDWVVIGGAKLYFEKFFGLVNPRQIAWANSCALLGCLVGSLFTGGLSDRFGRKKLLVLAAVLFAVSSVLTGWASSFNAFIVWRIIGGVAIGMASNLSPMYIAEIAPAHMRGRLVTLNQLTIVIGIFGAMVINRLIERAGPGAADWNTQAGWRWMFTVVAVPSLVFMVSSMFIPESPRWLVKNGRGDLARGILGRIGGADYAAEALAEIQGTIAAEDVQHVRLSELLEPKMIKILTIGIVLAVLQQWSATNVIFNYAVDIFKEAGYRTDSILFNIVLTGAVNLAFTFVAIGTVDKLGRRGLMLFGCLGIAASHILMGATYVLHLKAVWVLVFSLCTIGCYAMSLAPITWVLISEIFPNRIRGTAISLAVSALWIACFLLTFTFPFFKQYLGMSVTFFMYAAICIAGFVFVKLKVPETKGKTLEQIERDLVG